MKFKQLLFPLLILFLSALLSCSNTRPMKRDGTEHAIDRVAEQYVKLVLAVGQHDADYVDAYYGPPAWQEKIKTTKPPLEKIKSMAMAQVNDLDRIPLSDIDDVLRLRHHYLLKQLQALIARVQMLQGERFSFDAESKALYDAVAPSYQDSHFRDILVRLDRLLPGEESPMTIQERYESFRVQFIIPMEKLEAVFTAAINECRKRTMQHIELPDGESFTVEYVTGQPWGAYNWYKGNNHSLIQVNTDLPIYIDRAVDLGAHEGYPGHHVYNVLLEENLVKRRGWVEFSIYPLFSPQSLIAEGSANYGKDVAFPKAERIAFERDVLFPLAGLDSKQADRYYAIQELIERLSYADNEAARNYLDGKINRTTAVRWLMEYQLNTAARAEKQLDFAERYRSYVINYNLGQDLVKQYIESRGGTSENPEKRWREFADLLSSPRLPSGLK